MERLSKELTDIINEQDFCFTPGEMKTVEKALGRLKSYEDTGLEPEEIKELCTDDVAKIAKLFRHMIEDGSIDHLQELLEAEKDGRLVVLPCKVGDKVFVRMDDGAPNMARIQGISMSATCRDTILRFGGYPAISVWGSDRGKTWFMSLQEAEGALRKENSDA